MSLLALLVTGDVTAQDAGGPRIFSQATEPLVSVHFAGGTLAEFAAALKKAREGVNIVMPGLAALVELPALDLQQATVSSALESIAAVTSDEFRVRLEVHHGMGGQPVYAVSVRKMNPGKGSKQAGAKDHEVATRVEVFSLKSLTTLLPGEAAEHGISMKAETILMAVDTGLEIQTGVIRPEVRYHEDSGLLFVRARPQDLPMVGNVIRLLEQAQDRRRLAVAHKRSKK